MAPKYITSGDEDEEILTKDYIVGGKPANREFCVPSLKARV